MYYFTDENYDAAKFGRTGGNKARDDISAIFRKNNFEGISVASTIDRNGQSFFGKILSHNTIYRTWKKRLSTLQKGDYLIIQFPIIQHSVFLSKLLHDLQKKGVRIVLLIHDLAILREILSSDVKAIKKFRLRFEEESLLRQCDCMIVHNLQMKRKLAELGFDPNKMVILGLFDYLIPEKSGCELYAKTSKEAPLIIAGALRRYKSGYIYSLPPAPDYNLYGIDYEGSSQENIHYLGSFPPDDLPGAMEGSFGLVWDGDSINTCAGTFGEYLRINNPHKVSLYLASGLPVILWKEAALADYITRNNCGITVNSLEEIPDILQTISKEQYEEMRKHVLTISKRLRNGLYTIHALNRAEELIKKRERT